MQKLVDYLWENNFLYICKRNKNKFVVVSMDATRNYIVSKAVSLLLDNFNLYEASKVFAVDYRNLCAYVHGRKVMPLKLAFAILDYLSAKVVIFRGS